MKIFLRIFYIFLITLGISFAVLNSHPTIVNIYLVKFTLPLALLIILILAVGVSIGSLVMTKRYWRVKRQCSKLKSQLNVMEQELKNLRVMPVTEEYTRY